MDACVNLVIYEYTVKIYSPVVFMHSFFCCDQTKGSLLKLFAVRVDGTVFMFNEFRKKEAAANF